jgi:hypothetical protein
MSGCCSSGCGSVVCGIGVGVNLGVWVVWVKEEGKDCVSFKADEVGTQACAG